MLRFATLFLLALAIGATVMTALLLSSVFGMFNSGAAPTAVDFATLMLLLSIFMFVTGLWVAFVSLAFGGNRTEEAGGQHVSTDGSGATHVQMPNFAPLHAAYVAALFMPFPMWFAVTVAGASTGAVIAGWAIILGAVAGAPLWIVHLRRTGRFDLVFDSANVSVPAMYGRKAVERFARSSVENVHLWYIRHGGRGGGYFYRVGLRTRDGKEPLLAEWRSDRDRAEGFAKWLAARLKAPYVDKC